MTSAQSALNLGLIEAHDNLTVYVDYRHAHLTGFTYHLVGSTLIPSNIVFCESDIVLSEKILRLAAEGTRGGCVQRNRHILTPS